MAPITFRFPVLEPESCAGCGLCCEGIGSPVAVYTYLLTASGGYLYRPPNLPAELGEEIDVYFAELRRGKEPLGHCLWFNPETRLCKHHEWRPPVCRKYDVGCEACLNERRPYVVGGAPAVQPAPDVVAPPATQRGDLLWLAAAVAVYVVAFGSVYLLQRGRPSFPDPLSIAWYGLLLGVGPLAAIWWMLGAGWWISRTLAVGAVLFVAMLSADREHMGALVLAQFIASATPLAVMRSLGCSLGWPRQIDTSALRLPQFTLRHMALWTLTAALVLASVLQLQRWMEPHFVALCTFAAGFSVGPWSGLWAAFGHKLYLRRWVVVALTAPLGTYVVNLIEPIQPGVMLMIVLGQLGAVLLILLAARRSGIRWVG